MAMMRFLVQSAKLKLLVQIEQGPCVIIHYFTSNNWPDTVIHFSKDKYSMVLVFYV